MFNLPGKTRKPEKMKPELPPVVETVRTCPICSWSGAQFKSGGSKGKKRFDCLCPDCGSMERHRLAYMVAETRCELNYKRVVHVAPEKELSKWLQSKSANYLSIDLYRTAMAKMDLTDMTLENESCSLLWASHVLEHIMDDWKAIAEIFRVLEPGGVAFIQVPVWTFSTFEDPSKTSEEEREQWFYQKDHVRLYGLDIVDRFKEAGFSAEIHRAQDFGPEQMLLYGLSFASTNEVFVFRKPAP